MAPSGAILVYGYLNSHQTNIDYETTRFFKPGSSIP